jgi:hypothetical protein
MATMTKSSLLRPHGLQRSRKTLRNSEFCPGASKPSKTACEPKADRAATSGGTLIPICTTVRGYPLPQGEVSVDMDIRGKKEHLENVGYHGHNWGDVSMAKFINKHLLAELARFDGAYLRFTGNVQLESTT